MIRGGALERDMAASDGKSTGWAKLSEDAKEGTGTTRAGHGASKGRAADGHSAPERV